MEPETRKPASSIIRSSLVSVLTVSTWLCFVPSLKGSTPKNDLVASASERQQVLDLAASGEYDRLLSMLIERYDRSVRDYKGLLIRQERIGRRLGPEQHIAFKFRQEPFSVHMEWLRNPLGARQVLYAKGQNNDMMIAQPAGVMSWLKSIRVDPEGRQAAQSSLYPITEFGFRSNLARALEVYRMAAEKGRLEMSFSGPQTIDGREYFIVERVIHGGEHEHARLIIHVDLEYLVPTRISTFDSRGSLIGRYHYDNLEFNSGLTDADFDPRAYRLN